MTETFDELNAMINELLAQESTSLRNIAQQLAAYKEIIDPKRWGSLVSGFDSINAGHDSMTEYIKRLFAKAIVDRTGLHIRLYFDEWLTRCEGSMHLGYVMCDVDRFHDYNASYGHIQGDKALECIAQQFKWSLETTLACGEHLFAARYGGEELCALIDGFQADQENLICRMEVIRAHVQAYEIPCAPAATYHDTGYKTRTITIAGGIRKAGEQALSLVKRVDDALKNAKNTNNRNAVIAA